MREIPTPDWLVRRYGDIVKAALGVGGWAEEYSHGYIQPDEGDFPKELPATFPVWGGDAIGDKDEGVLWKDWPHRDLYADVRSLYDTDFPGLTHVERAQRHKEIEAGTWQGPPDREYHEFHFGTYAVFRLTKVEHELTIEGYEDTAGTENEKFLEDDDHVIIVYML